MKRLFIGGVACLMLISCHIYSQDIKGVYFRGSLSLPSQWVSNYTMTVTLLTDASKNINRPSVKVSLGPSNGYATLPIASTFSINNLNVPTYTCTLNSTGGFGRILYTDSFWVAALNNFSVIDKSRIKVMTDLGWAASAIDSGPEVTNLPLSLSNFTIAGNQITYNPMCIDADGDSLAYELGPLSGTEYRIPVGATINPLTGLFSFSKDSTDQGLYAFSIRINEWRKDNGIPSLLGLTNLAFVLTTNLTLGLHDESASVVSLALYPNPANDVLNFQTSGINENGSFQLEIINALGEVVLREQNVALSNPLNISFLPQGMYLLHASRHSYHLNSKFIKQ